MKGILFTELIEMMEDLMGLEITNKVIEDANLRNKGAFTSIGNYSHKEMMKLLESLSVHVKTPKEQLLISYGEYFFYRSCQKYQQEISNHKDTFNLLLHLQSFLNMEVRKLNPKATVPTIKAKLVSPECLQILFRSKENMSFLFEGVILGCINYYQEPITLSREDLGSEYSKARFSLKRKKL